MILIRIHRIKTNKRKASTIKLVLFLYGGYMDTKEQWYKIIKDEAYCSEILDIFYSLHDYMITEMDYDYQNKTLKIYFRYDTDDEGVVMKFIGVKKLNVYAEDESQWLTGANIQVTNDNTLLWYALDDRLNSNEVVNGTDYNWVEAEEVLFAWLDKNNDIKPLTEEQLNPIWKKLNYETDKYEEVQKHFLVYEVN